MNKHPIHENLDTSFVNLSALIKYLRRRQFVGSVNIRLNGYKASVRLKKDNKLEVNEHDQISGKVSVGEEALQRLLARSKEPGGTINVYQLLNETEETNNKTSVIESQSKLKNVFEENKFPEINDPIIDIDTKPVSYTHLTLPTTPYV